ncbi:MAG: hypothetical protein M3137_04045 [Actinomycetota bacterium]|nr:hypothetical protein [Actinomycetota bacterium]
MTEPSTTETVRRRIGDRGGNDLAPDAGQSRRSIADRPAPSPARPATSVPDRPTPADRQTEEAPAPVEPQSKRRSLRRPRGRASILVGALVVVLLAATVFLGLKVHSQSNLNSLRSSALKSATADGVLLSSYDYRNLTGPGSAWANVEKNATPTFRKNFLSTSGTLGKLLSQYNATATGKVVTAGVASFSPSRAVVLLFIDQTVNNSVQKSASATQPLRTQVTLLRQNDKWLIDDLQVPK